jgi:hypothetical protein
MQDERLRREAALISIVLPFAFSALGRWISSTPFLNVALTFSVSTPAGSERVRENAPAHRALTM